MIIFSDPYPAVGGGQVALRGFLNEALARGAATGVVMPSATRAALHVPSEVISFDSRAAFAASPLVTRGANITLVSNSNRGLPRDLQLSAQLRRQGAAVRTAAVVHSYPRDAARRAVVRASLSRFDEVFPVEPGLASLAKSSEILPPLAALTPPSNRGTASRGFSGMVKSFARPDKSKGLHLLPPLFKTLSDRGIQCSVALGTPLQSDEKYTRLLRRGLEPWLVDGQRNAEWVEAGDMFVVPSIAGEAVCLTAQEALSRKAFVLSSRVGYLPYLMTTVGAHLTFKTGSSSAMLKAAETALALSDDEYARRCTAASKEILRRRGAFERALVDSLHAPLNGKS